jgi:anaerobic sulfite reductase subunit A
MKISHQQMNQWLEILNQVGAVYGPVLKQNGGSFSDLDRIVYDQVSQIEELVVDEKSYFSPKELVFPTRETLFYFEDQQARMPELDEKPIFVFLRACDISGLDRLDEIFLNNGPFVDPYYLRRRNRIHTFLIGCPKSFDTCFCVSMGTNRTEDFDVGFGFKDGQIQLTFGSDRLKAYASQLLAWGGVESSFEPEYVTENDTKVNVPAVGKVNQDDFLDPLWQPYSSRCIACGRCNTSCPTCSCFTMQDVAFSGGVLGERRRRWASCHVKEYSTMAGGHEFRKTNGEKMRFKTMHKINDYHKRFDKHMCVGCGRCDDVCPEYISFAKCINLLNEVVENREEQTYE